MIVNFSKKKNYGKNPQVGWSPQMTKDKCVCACVITGMVLSNEIK